MTGVPVFKGNVIDLAVGTIIGAGFGKIVSGLVDNIIMPLVAVALPNPDWKNKGLVLKEIAGPDGKMVATELKYGAFVGVIVDFLIIAVVLFIIVSAIQKAMEKANAKAAAAKKIEDDKKAEEDKKKAEEDKKKAEAEAAKDKIEQVLLTEIRDLLKAQAAK
jgi:large conductance mechanosensitive channel